MQRYEITFDHELKRGRSHFTWALYRGESKDAVLIDFGRSGDLAEAGEDLTTAIDMDLEHGNHYK